MSQKNDRLLKHYSKLTDWSFKELKARYNKMSWQQRTDFRAEAFAALEGKVVSLPQFNKKTEHHETHKKAA